MTEPLNPLFVYGAQGHYNNTVFTYIALTPNIPNSCIVMFNRSRELATLSVNHVYMYTSPKDAFVADMLETFTDIGNMSVREVLEIVYDYRGA